MSTPRTSVIVPSRGGAHRLPTVFDGFAQQTDPDFEVIIVLDGDIDGSRAVVDAEHRFALRCVEFPENRGRVAALNAGFDAAQGSILVRCDDDLRVPPGFIAAHVHEHDDAAVRGEKVGVVGPTLNIFENTPYARAYGRRNAEAMLKHAYSRPSGETWRLWAANCSVTSALYREIGPYDSDYRYYGWEDVDYGYRIHCAGHLVVVSGGCQADHLGAAPNLTSRALRAYQSGAARRLFDAKHPEARLAPPQPGSGIWGLGVGTLARVLTEQRTRRVATVFDRLLGVVPTRVGEKLAALAVEAASVAGYRSARTPEVIL
ncbi:glycosyltransferase family 2 protein [Devriesea agamarum]|uniref:glycosyltransferase family 2 protein n=1 Tax=Devriesea agamarum TaxID=472569 RepID=UPI00071E5BB6|nr:glycosyltransferase family A protein [Devriesea agamarum]